MIFVADSLRYDYVPRNIANRGNLVRTFAPSLHTPTSLASLITGRNPQNHNVHGFFDPLDPRVKTIFDFFENGSYYDHPDDAMSNIVLRHCPPSKEISQMEEPFVWIERALESHIPYGIYGHGTKIWKKNYEHTRSRGIINGKDHLLALSLGEIDPVKEYMRGVNKVGEHFWTHVDELKSMGVFERTLIVFTSDHGELLGEYGMFGHNYPPCKELVEVPTVLLNTTLNAEIMRTIDIFPTVLGILGMKSPKGCDGVDIRKARPKNATNLMKRTLTLWEWRHSKMHLSKYYRKILWLKLDWTPIPISVVILDRRLCSKIYAMPLLPRRIRQAILNKLML